MAVDLGGIDPWVVQPRERARYEEQFRSLNPINGVITGDQAKGFFLQSQLPPPILGKIWDLADADADGRMDINEFSIACKLINLKLKGFQIPGTLPPVLKALVTQSPLSSQPKPAINGTAVSSAPLISSQPVPTLPTQPLISSQPLTSTVPPLIPVEPIPTAATMTSRPSLTGTATIPQAIRAPIIPPQPTAIPAQPGYPVIPGQPMIPASVIPQQIPPVIPQQVAPVIPQAPIMSQVPPVVPPVVGMAGIAQPPAVPPMPAVVQPFIPPVSGIVPTQVPLADAVKAVEKVQPMEPPSLTSPILEWGIPHQSKLKYTQLFNTTDRARTGFLSGPQARNLMVQTRLPQAILARIWNLSDADSDGRLSCEEFVLALHLCDMAKEGRPIPDTLPPELVPPTLRRKSRTSISLSDDNKDILSAIQNSVTFEDKRKENFDKGQAELDRRRAALLEAQRKEQEERERKEREEQEKLEKIRAEQEARRQQELQKQLQRQRELEQQQEEERRRATEQREAARKELERQRQQEWERQRTQELESQRMREQDNVLRLKARNQALAIELATLTNKVKELSSKISETRTGVSGVKSTIDGMRTTRDSHMSEMAALKSKLKEQNQRLLALTQEKAKLEARNKTTAAADAAASEQIRLAFTNKQITIKHLNEKLVDLQNEVKTKTEDVENNNAQLKELKTQLKNLVNECETLYTTYGEKRDEILQLKAATGSGGWGAPAASSWGTTDSWGTTPAADSWGTTAVPSAEHRKYRAIYEFQSRNPDELSFQPGDIILVPVNQTAEPGWLAGELRGLTGWFPESYVEPIDQEVDVVGVTDVISNQGKQHLEGILEVPEGGNEIKPVGDELNEYYVSVYPYQSQEVGDLSFEQGETILVIKKEMDWWTGVIGDRTGIFPSNYVQKAETQPEAPAASVITPAADSTVPDDDNVFMQPGEEQKPEPEKSPIPGPGSTCVSGRETPADFEHTKPVTPDFSNIPAAQTKIGKKGEIATVIAPYQATSSEQLSLQRGQLVCIRKKTTTGWWEGELQAKGKKKQVGWFPASYVKIMASRRLSQTTPDIEAEQNIEKVVAMFPYKAQNDDELSFEKDDVITLLAREEAAWWRGELRGTTGLFPSNYVMPLDSQ